MTSVLDPHTARPCGMMSHMAISPVRRARVPEALESAARDAAPELATLEISDLLRAGLAMLARARDSAVVAEAIATARMSRTAHTHGGGRPSRT